MKKVLIEFTEDEINDILSCLQYKLFNLDKKPSNFLLIKKLEEIEEKLIQASK